MYEEKALARKMSDLNQMNRNTSTSNTLKYVIYLI